MVFFFNLCIKSGFVLIRNKDLIHFLIFLSIHCIYRVVCEMFFLFFFACNKDSLLTEPQCFIMIIIIGPSRQRRFITFRSLLGKQGQGPRVRCPRGHAETCARSLFKLWTGFTRADKALLVSSWCISFVTERFKGLSVSWEWICFQFKRYNESNSC